MSLFQSISIVWIKEGGGKLGSTEFPSIISNVEDLTGYMVKEGDVATDSFGDECFAAARETDHDDN